MRVRFGNPGIHEMEKALNKLFRLGEILGELLEELGGADRGDKGGGQDEGKN